MANYLFDTKEIFFPVKLCKLYWESPDKKDMFGNIQNPCDDFYAVVDMEREYVFSTVTKSYHLILNRDASDLGFDLFASLFKLSDNNLCYATDYFTTTKRSEYEMDIVRDFDEKMPLVNDGWRPMAKIINSYNKKRKLTFHIGYCRVDGQKLIKGAFLIPGLSIELSSAHDKSINDARIWMFQQLHKNPNMEMNAIESSFQKKMNQLKKIHLGEEMMLPMFCKIYGLSLFQAKTDIQKQKLSDALYHAYYLTKEHTIIHDDKADAYTLFYALMEYATHYEIYSSRAQTAKSQLQLGSWLNDFLESFETSGVDVAKYVGRDAIVTAEWFFNQSNDK